MQYPTFDGREIPALLYLPTNSSRRPLPTVVLAHGGPESQSRPNFNPLVQYLTYYGPLPKQMLHGDHRNALFFDFHVGKVDGQNRPK